jgi:hypothetical protein
MFFNRHFTFSVAALACCCLLSACNDEENPTTPSSNQASVRFVNALEGTTQPLVLTTNGTAGSAVSYQNFGGCQTIPAGTENFSFALNGSSTPLVTIPAQTFTGGGRYTVVATGNPTLPTFLVMNDAYTAPASGRGWLRVVNAVGPTNPFDVYVGTPSAPLGTVNQTNTAYNVTQSYLNVPTGATQVQVTDVGTQTVTGATSSFTVTGGTPQTVFVTPATTAGGAYTTFVVPTCP